MALHVLPFYIHTNYYATGYTTHFDASATTVDHSQTIRYSNEEREASTTYALLRTVGHDDVYTPSTTQTKKGRSYIRSDILRRDGGL